MASIAAWTELPELVTANQGEEGIQELCELLFERGIGVEAGLLSLDDAQRFVAAGIASWAVNRRAVARGHGIRTGLEDTPVLPDGRTAAGNGELVAAAAALLRSR